MERWVAKIISLGLIFVVVLVATLLPLKIKGMFLRWGKRGEDIISYLMCFGGGVFFSIYLLHMAPDAQEIVKQHIVEPYNINYPLGEFLIGMGFFFMVFSEKIVHKVKKKMNREKSQEESHPITPVSDMIGRKLSQTQVHSLQTNNNRFSLDLCDSDSEINQPNHTKTNVVKKQSNGYDLLENHQTPFSNVDIPPEKEYDDFEDADHSHGHGHSHDIDLTGSRSLILLIALSLHHVFEGISVGLKHTVMGVWTITIAILSHEIIIAFSLGLQLVKAYKSTRMIVMAAFLCTIMVPIGIAVGLLLMETGHGETEAINVANGILQSIATGVFIYVTFFEILMEEISGNDTSLTKLFFILLGFAAMALLALIPEDTEIEGTGDATNCTMQLVCM